MIKAEQDRPLLASSRTEYIQVETPSIVTCQHPLGGFLSTQTAGFMHFSLHALKCFEDSAHQTSLVQQNKL